MNDTVSVAETPETKKVETIAEAMEIRKLSSGIKVTTICPMKYVGSGNEVTIPTGTELKVHFSQTHPNSLYFEYGGKVRRIGVGRAYRTFAGSRFKKPPTERALWKYSDSGISRTVTGYKTEPDGFGEDGSPSWLLALGYI